MTETAAPAVSADRLIGRLGALATSPSLRLAVRRLLIAVPVLWGVSALTFVVMSVLPGNAAQHILAFSRYDRAYGDVLVFLINLSREHFQEFRLGVPFPGRYYKVLDTDAREFGGNGHNWVSEYDTAPQPAYHHPHSFRTQLLPLHGMVFRYVR